MTHAPRVPRRAAARLPLALATAAVVVASLAAASPAAAQPLGKADRQFVDRTVRQVMADGRLPGASISISGPKGSYTRAYGVADRRSGAPMEVDDHVRIASITKTFTATAVLRQVARGKLALSDTIDRWFRDVPNAGVITVRDLLAMRSGLYDFTADPPFLREFTADPMMRFSPRRVVDIVSGHAPVAQPDTETKYTDANYVLLGLILEDVTGKSAEQAITDDVIRPLGLRETSFPTTAAIPRPASRGYFAGDEGKGRIRDYTKVNPKVAWTAGAIVSTLGDLHAYGRKLATGALLPPKLQAERLDFGEIPNPGGPSVGYGLGILRIGDWLGHDGAIFGFSTVTFFNPTTKTEIAATANLASNFSTPTLTMFVEIAEHFDPSSLKKAGR